MGAETPTTTLERKIIRYLAMHSRSHYTNSHAEAHSLEGQDTFVSIHPLCPLEFGSKENGTHARCDKERLANQIL